MIFSPEKDRDKRNRDGVRLSCADLLLRGLHCGLPFSASHRCIVGASALVYLGKPRKPHMNVNDTQHV